MSRRTSVILDDDIYEKLVEESLKRYGTPRAISKVLNELLREHLSGRAELLRLIYSEKLRGPLQVSSRSFVGGYRRGLSDDPRHHISPPPGEDRDRHGSA